MPAPIPPPVATPALKSERFNTPLATEETGKSELSLWSNVVLICDVVVSSAGAAPETSIEVVAPLISRVICRVLVLFSSILKLLIVVVAKFDVDADMLYVPTGKLLKRYSPESFATV